MAAGLGFKTFTTGEVLTAANVNGYLMQGIWVFASTAARDAAVTSPQEGNFAFTKDTNGLWYYDGAAWVASGATGDIEGVTAGIGISGGGTSGTVTVTNSMATAIDAKGDLVVGTGADAFSKLTVGANGTILTADSAEATGMKWAAAAGGGAGMTFIGATTFTTSSAVNVNDVFSATYSNYMLLTDFVGSASTDINLRYRVAGADNSTSNYNSQRAFYFGTSVSADRSASANKHAIYTSTTTGSFIQYTFFNPFETAKTGSIFNGVFYAGTSLEGASGFSQFDATTSFTGFSLFPTSGTITGTLRVYGLANS